MSKVLELIIQKTKNQNYQAVLTSNHNSHNELCMLHKTLKRLIEKEMVSQKSLNEQRRQ